MSGFIHKFLFLILIAEFTQAGILHNYAEQGHWAELALALVQFDSEYRRQEELNALDEKKRTVLDIVAILLLPDNEFYISLRKMGARRTIPDKLAEQDYPLILQETDTLVFPPEVVQISKLHEATEPKKVLADEKARRLIQKMIEEQTSSALTFSKKSNYEKNKIREDATKKCGTDKGIDYCIPPSEAMDNENTLHPGQRIICFHTEDGSYRVIAVFNSLGRGSDGEVFVGIEVKKSSDKGNDRPHFLVVKIIENPLKFHKKKNLREPKEKFEDERVILKHVDPRSEYLVIENELNPENGRVTKEGHFYLFSEYTGINLADLPAPLSVEFRYEICIKVLESVNQLHALEIIHLDIKQRNLLLDSAKRLSICDFGDACFTDKPHTKPVGTDHFQGPEAFLPLGERPGYCEAWDLYMVGILVMQLVTGFNPQDEAYQFKLRDHLSIALETFISEGESSSNKQPDAMRLGFIRLVKKLCHPKMSERPGPYEFDGLIKDLKKMTAAHINLPALDGLPSEKTRQRHNSTPKKHPSYKLPLERVRNFASSISPSRNSVPAPLSSPPTPSTPPSPESALTRKKSSPKILTKSSGNSSPHALGSTSPLSSPHKPMPTSESSAKRGQKNSIPDKYSENS